MALPDRFKKMRRGETWQLLDDVDLAAGTANTCAFDAILAVLGAVYVDVGFYLAKEGNRVGFIEYVHVIDHPERKQHLCALPLRHDGPMWSLVRCDRCVAIQT